jgi:hypothetical protein
MTELIPIPVESTAAATAAKTARFLLPCFIHCEGTAFQDLPVQLGDGSFHICFRSQFYKGKASRTAGFLVAHQSDIGNRDVGAGKKLGQFGIGDTKRQISNKKLIRHRASTYLEDSSEIGDGRPGWSGILKNDISWTKNLTLFSA